MALPRFYRLEASRQQHILAVAKQHIARDGVEGSSYNKIIADCGISKTTAYQYFDGKDDLVAEAFKDTFNRMLDVLGPWEQTSTTTEFWTALRQGANRLQGFLFAHAQEATLLQMAYSSQKVLVSADGSIQWFNDLLDNGIQLGVVRSDIDRSLLTNATISVFRVIDAWVLDAYSNKEQRDLEQGFKLLRSLWSQSF